MSATDDSPANGGTNKPKTKPSRYRILWGRIPDPEGEEGTRPVFREILNPQSNGGYYEATSAETARRAAFEDETTEQHPFIQKALRGHGVILKHVAENSWGDWDVDPGDVLKVSEQMVATRTGRI